MIRTFAELESDRSATVDDLKDTLKDYAKSGASVLASVVIEVISRLMLTAADRRALRRYALLGAEQQWRVCHALTTKQKEAGEYLAIAVHLRRKSH